LSPHGEKLGQIAAPRYSLWRLFYIQALTPNARFTVMAIGTKGELANLNRCGSIFKYLLS
jgi:hypothetical protein